MAVDEYYFDASISGPTDPDTVWTDDAEAFDGSNESGDSAYTSTAGTSSTNELYATGTTATGTGTITQVRVRQIDIANIWDYVTLDTPTGGWSWTVLANLKVIIYAEQLYPEFLGKSPRALVLSDEEELGTALSGAGGSQAYVSMVEIEVTSEVAAAPATSINIGDTWKTVSGANVLQVNIGDTWKAVAGAQVNIADTWKPIVLL